ncbi:homoserine kinase [Striga asiatica]|uniref:Homoserine kinase n=1 Tax=Striga asiatica TaxID=4170 RepID=A0A5A7R0I6_STRAF|nr:homoserine kinase [Striga asiatica]
MDSVLDAFSACECAYRDVGVTRAPLRVGGGENGVDEDECADYLGAERRADVVPLGDGVGAAAEAVVGALHDGLHQADAAHSAEALRHHVRHRAYQRHLPRQEQTEGYRRVDVSA